MDKKLVGPVMILYIAWGLNWVVMTVANRYFPAIVFVALRFSLGALVLILYCLIRRVPLPEKRFWPWIALSGILMMALNNLLVQIATRHLGAGLVAVLNYSMSVWTAILGMIFLHEKMTARKAGGIILALVGLFVLMRVNVSGELWAVFMMIGASVIWAVSNLITKAKLAGCSRIAMTTGQMICGAAVLDVAALVTNHDPVQWTLPGLGALVYNGVLCSAVAFVIWSRMLDKMEAGTASVTVMAVPAIGVLAGVIFLHEPMTVSRAIGMILLFVGILTVVGAGLPAKKRSRK